jgi:MerR family transcriptional regulator, light-induced transcriptional regulator
MITPTRLRVSELARLVGVSAYNLRAWEKRYGLFSPERTASGYRQYGDDDVRRADLMMLHLAAGRPAAEAARLAKAAAPVSPGQRHSAADLARLRARIVHAFGALDEATAQAAFDEVLAATDPITAILEVAMPAVAQVAQLGVDGPLSVAHMHFAGHVVRTNLIRLAHGWEKGDGRTAWLACPSRELHDLSLIAFGVLIHEYGWGVRFYGANTPLNDLAAAARQSPPDAIVITAARRRTMLPARHELSELARVAPLFIAGRGSSREIALAVGATHLGGGLGEEAAVLAAKSDARKEGIR